MAAGFMEVMMRKAKAIKIVLGILACAVILSMTGIMAYLADGETAVNQSVIGGNRVEIVEEYDPPEEVKPGTVIHKDVKVKNVGHSDCYVRVMAVFSDSAMADHCTVDWNLNDFVYNQTDGYYYYPGVLEKSESTPSLFTTVTVSGSADEKDIVPFSIIVYAESYQAGGFSDYQDAWQHFERNKK